MQVVNKDNFNDFKSIKIKKKILSSVSSIYHEMLLFEELLDKDSFLILENSKILAIVPLHFEKNQNANEKKIGSYKNLSIPGPIVIENLSDRKFKKLINLVIDEIEIRSKKKDLKNIKINFSDTINYKVGSQNYFNLLEKLSGNGYRDSCCIGLRIDLKKKFNEISKSFSKGHKAEIKKQSFQEYYFFSYAQKKIDYKEFLFFLTGRNNNESKVLYELFKKNKVYIVFSKQKKKELFCCLFTLAGNTVEYFFSKSSLNQHSLIVAAINFFKKFKELEFLNLGIINSLNNFESQSKKKNNIAIFKKGFGGEKFKYIFFKKEY